METHGLVVAKATTQALMQYLRNLNGFLFVTANRATRDAIVFNSEPATTVTMKKPKSLNVPQMSSTFIIAPAIMKQTPNGVKLKTM